MLDKLMLHEDSNVSKIIDRISEEEIQTYKIKKQSKAALDHFTKAQKEYVTTKLYDFLTFFGYFEGDIKHPQPYHDLRVKYRPYLIDPTTIDGSPNLEHALYKKQNSDML